MGILSLLVLLGAWVGNFHQYQISPDSSDWSDFGGYMGGAVSSIISMLALFGVAIGISEQSKSNKLLSSQSILEGIRSFEKDIDSSLKELHLKLVIDEQGVEIDIYQLLMTARLSHLISNVLPKYKESLERIENEKISLLDGRLAQEELLSRTASRIKMMGRLISDHEILAGNSHVATYYRSKYKAVFKKLDSLGYDCGSEF
jgi:hypothetical protein|tara:strand:+ start:363 stop:968 length:606 start_codon:yes stop_codon:yes gene_type:complete